MDKPDPARKFVGIQISPVSFVDEGVDEVLDTLQHVGVNVLMVGTVSWLGLKVGRSISHQFDGWPDHGVPEPFALKGGAYFNPRPEYYSRTSLTDFRAKDPETEGVDVLDLLIPEARARGMIIMPELMEPALKYAGHGSVNHVKVPGLPQTMEVDVFGRRGSEPCTNNPDYRGWWHSLVEDQCRNYDIDGDDQSYLDFTHVIMEADRRVVESQRPVPLPVELSEELHLRGPDAAALAYRRSLAAIGVFS